MPRITEARREARRAEIVAAARRCFSRDGFHQTSMPDIAAEAGVSVGAPYRYFTGKDELIVEIVGDAFRLLFEPVTAAAAVGPAPDLAGLVTAALDPVGGEVTTDAAGQPVPVAEMLRCAVQSWAELLRDEKLRGQALAGLEQVRARTAEALRRGQAAGTIPAALDPDRGTRVVVALLHGFVLQRAVFGLDDTAGFAADVRSVLVAPAEAR